MRTIVLFAALSSLGGIVSGPGTPTFAAEEDEAKLQEIRMEISGMT